VPDLYADIVLPLPMEQPYTYRVPARFHGRVAVGMRAVVPVMNRYETGFIVALKQSTDVERVKELVDLPGEGPDFDTGMLSLCRWMAGYYCCSWGEALQCAIPAGLRAGGQLRYQLASNEIPSGRFTEAQRQVVATLYREGPLTAKEMEKHAGAEAAKALPSLAKRGILLAETVMKRAATAIQTETYVRLLPENAPDNAALEALQRRAPKQAALYLDLLYGEPVQPAATLCMKHGTSSAALKSLEARSYVQRFEEEYYRRPELGGTRPDPGKHPLNAEQQAAHEAITGAMKAGQFQTFLLHGITGSGKTEVYLQVIEDALAQGKDAIILVPEISLTPQTVGRFYARFQENIAVLHSALSTGERYDEWRRAQRGEVRIVVGARSAVFAPMKNLGVIVVDEEHDTSYKQGENPRYHARDVAIMRAHLSGAVCVLGSATPSIESYYNSEQGKSVRLELNERATRGTLPQVTVLDMRTETKEASGKVVLAPLLEAAVKQRVEAGEQVILLLNRRGFSPYVMCPSCGWVAECEHCNVSLTYHRPNHTLLCHYCGESSEPPQSCPKCSAKTLVYLGLGTQRAEEYLMQAFPTARIARMDADTTAEKGGHARILGRFAKGELDILIGTQMLAKGHDYPAVTLAGVIHADTGLGLPDFRAAEQTFNLLTQVAGRAGRGDLPGEVIIQTYRPKHYAVQAAAAHDYKRFYAEELGHRQSAGYPPFRRMANFLLESEDPAEAERWAFRLRTFARKQIEAKGGGVVVLGPSPTVVARVKRQYRWQLALLCKSTKRLNECVRATRDAFAAQKPPAAVKLKIDLDPYGLG
jgi:primosomal protein N' (replication factor Y)